jgi:DHA1 family purine base/nucleoside efflux pump-like MFS transporter
MHSAGKTKLQQTTDEKSRAGRLFVPVLFIAFLSTWIIESLTSVFLIEVATTFFGSPNPVSIATVGQLVTLSSAVSVIFGLLLGVLSVKYDLKKLLLLGVLCITLGTAGCFLAPTFLFMQIFYSVEGIGTIVVASMAFALVGQFLILSKRPKATGWIIAGAAMAGIASSFAISLFFTGTEGWRSYLLWLALPISVLSLAAVYFGVPSVPQKPKTVGKEAYLSSLKQVFLRKSSASCLIGCMFRQTAIGFGSVYSATFFRDKFGLPLASAALIVVIAGLVLYSLGSVVGGHLVNRFGRKRQLVGALLISSPSLLVMAFVPELWMALAFHYLGNFVYSMSNSPSVSLTIEQAPEFRGTIMSNMEMMNILGVAIGAAVGGVALVLSGWTGMILVFVALELTAAAIFYFLTKDPCRT